MPEEETPTEPERLGTSPEDQEAWEEKKQSDLQAQREEHNRRVAPGGAELPEPVTGQKAKDYKTGQPQE